MAFTLTSQLEFAAAHRLRGYEGNCARLHGHNWKVEVSVGGSQLNDVGMLMDFKEIKRRSKAIIDELDHFYLNDIAPFNDELNPTAENIAWFLFDRLSKDINDARISVASVKVWENDRNCATFSRD